jgi:hypothetical protein
MATIKQTHQAMPGGSVVLFLDNPKPKQQLLVPDIVND